MHLKVFVKSKVVTVHFKCFWRRHESKLANAKDKLSSILVPPHQRNLHAKSTSDQPSCGTALQLLLHSQTSARKPELLSAIRIGVVLLLDAKYGLGQGMHHHTGTLAQHLELKVLW